MTAASSSSLGFAPTHQQDGAFLSAIIQGYHPWMKLTSLRALVSAVEEGSLRSAARRLGVSQPAVTKLIRELERELGTSLLGRSRTGVLATAQGMVLYERARAAERELAHAVDEIKQLGGSMTGALTIGAAPVAVMLLIPETLRTFAREFPQIQLRISEEFYAAQLARLRKGELDVAVGFLREELPAGEFVAERLMPVSMRIVMRKGHRMSGSRRLSDFAKVPWVYTAATPDSGYVKSLFESHGMPAPPVGALVNSTLALLAIITTSECVGLLPQQIAAHPFAAQYMETVDVEEDPLTAGIVALARAEVAVKPSVRHFLAHMHRAAHGIAGPN
ncbi:MAG: LysR family transcriptional regulator [Massilia sp.]